jgi:hypothetical protein
MPIIPPAKVEKLIVEQSSKTGTVKLVGNATIFKIANNNDTGFEAMVDVLASAKGFDKNVNLDVGPGNEIDRIGFETL